MEWSSFYYPMVAAGAWLMAQLIKIALSLGQDGITFSDFLTSGGMPSAHVTLVTSMATLIGLNEGFDSPLFGIMLTFWGIVVYDSLGVRRATGENVQILQRIIGHLKLGNQKRAYNLALGHTPSQVFGGLILGFAWGALMAYALFQS